MTWFILGVPVVLLIYGIGYYMGYGKRQALGKIVEKDLSAQLARAQEKIVALQKTVCGFAGIEAANEVFLNLMGVTEGGEDATE